MRILVVDDDPWVREIAVDHLRECGIATLEAADGAAAIALLEGGERVDAVFSDVAMPVMDGVTLAFRVRRRWPAVAVVLTSGHLPNPDRPLPLGVAFVPKPYRMADVLGRIGALVGSARAALAAE